MSDPSSQSSPSEAPKQQSDASAPPTGETSDAPKKRRRRRRRGGKGKSASETPEGRGTGAGAAAGAPAAGLDPGLAALAGGLLSHVDDREVPCASGNCNNTWTWTAAEQIQAYGQPAPRRECASCGNTSATEVRCSVESCKRTWTWTREAQLKHKSWAKKRSGDEGGGRRRRRRGEGTPRRKCELCHKKHARLEERASACKVHGCTRPVTLDRDAQLRAWAALATTDLDAEGTLPKHMCDVCREFCRTRDDRKVPCGRPGCERSWMYKRGAQLQAFLAGRFEDPLRLCGKCEGEARNAAVRDPSGARIPANIEIMPCIVPGCPDNWHFRQGTKIPACSDGDQPVERMCDQHRVANGATARGSAAAESTPDKTPAESGPADQSVEDHTAPAQAEPAASDRDNADAVSENTDADPAIS